MNEQLINGFYSDFTIIGTTENSKSFNRSKKMVFDHDVNRDIVRYIADNFSNSINYAIDNDVSTMIYDNTTSIDANDSLSADDIKTFNKLGFTVLLHPLQKSYIKVDGLDVVLTRNIKYDNEQGIYSNILLKKKPILFEVTEYGVHDDVLANTFTLSCKYNIDVDNEDIVVVNSPKK